MQADTLALPAGNITDAVIYDRGIKWPQQTLGEGTL